MASTSAWERYLKIRPTNGQAGREARAYTSMTARAANKRRKRTPPTFDDTLAGGAPQSFSRATPTKARRLGGKN